jgi:hypothetical protein
MPFAHALTPYALKLRPYAQADIYPKVLRPYALMPHAYALRLQVAELLIIVIFKKVFSTRPPKSYDLPRPSRNVPQSITPLCFYALCPRPYAPTLHPYDLCPYVHFSLRPYAHALTPLCRGRNGEGGRRERAKWGGRGQGMDSIKYKKPDENPAGNIRKARWGSWGPSATYKKSPESWFSVFFLVPPQRPGVPPPAVGCFSS